MATVSMLDAVCDDCHSRYGENIPHKLLSMPTSRIQPCKKWGYSFDRDRKTCKIERCPLCRRQGTRYKPLPLYEDPDFVRPCRDPYSTVRDAPAAPPAAPTAPARTNGDGRNFNKAVLIVIWLMIALWVSVMVIMSFDNRAYLKVGRGNPTTGWGSLFDGLGQTIGVYSSNSKGDTFSIACLVLCILNVIMVFGRVVSCGGSGPTNAPQSYFALPAPPQGMQCYSSFDDSQLQKPLAINYDQDIMDEQSQEINLTTTDTFTNYAMNPHPADSAVIRSNQFRVEPEHSEFCTNESEASFPRYGPQTLAMDSISKQKDTRLSQYGDDWKRHHNAKDTTNTKKQSSPPKSKGMPSPKISPAKQAQLVRANAQSSPQNLSKERSKKNPDYGLHLGHSVRESKAPILGRGRPENDHDLDLLGRKVNKANEFYSPAHGSVFLAKPNVSPSVDGDPYYLGTLMTDEERVERRGKSGNTGTPKTKDKTWKDTLSQQQKEWLNRGHLK